MLEDQSRNKDYADSNVWDIAFHVGEQILLIVPPMKGEMRISKKGKHSPRNIGLFDVLDNVRPVVYRLAYHQVISIMFIVPCIRDEKGTRG